MSSTDTRQEALQHYRDNKFAYEHVRRQLERVRRKFENGNKELQRKMLRTSHRFAVLSIQAPVDRHEAAFKQLEGMENAEKDPLRSLNYWKNKAEWIKDLDGCHETIDSVIDSLLEGDLDTAHKTLIDDVKGVGAVKAAFTIAMLGFTGKMCLDTNVQQAASIDEVYSGVVVDKYEKQCETVLAAFSTLSHRDGLDLDPFMVQWVLFDYRRGEVSLHKPYFDAQEGK